MSFTGRWDFNIFGLFMKLYDTRRALFNELPGLTFGLTYRVTGFYEIFGPFFWELHADHSTVLRQPQVIIEQWNFCRGQIIQRHWTLGWSFKVSLLWDGLTGAIIMIGDKLYSRRSLSNFTMVDCRQSIIEDVNRDGLSPHQCMVTDNSDHAMHSSPFAFNCADICSLNRQNKGTKSSARYDSTLSISALICFSLNNEKI